MTRPRLIIEAPDPDCLILDHSTQAENGEWYEERVYGFYVRNVGRSVSEGTQFHLLKIEHRNSPDADFSVDSEHSYPLGVYRGANTPRGELQAALVPSAAALVGLAGRREDSDAVFPLVSGLPDYFEEDSVGAYEYRFTVVAFSDRAKASEKVLTVGTGRSVRRRTASPSPAH